MSDLERLVRLKILFSRILYVLLVVLFMTMVGIMMAQVFWRYFLELPLSWSEEIARYLFIVVTYIGAAIAVHEKLHIEINLADYFIDKYVNDGMLAKKINIYIDIVGSSVIFLVTIFFSYFSFNYAMEDYRFEQVSTSVGLPLFIVSGTISISLIIMALFSLSQVLICSLQIKKTPIEAL